MNRHDGDEEPTDVPQVAAAAIINRNISRHEENVKFAAFAYHMFHSGQIYNTIAHPDSRERATIIDRLAEAASSHGHTDFCLISCYRLMRQVIRVCACIFCHFACRLKCGL